MLNEPIVQVGILLLLLPIWIAFSLRRTVRRMLSAPEAKEDSAAAPEIIASVPEGFRSLLDSEGFRFTKAYSFHSSRFGIWIRISPEPPLRFFCTCQQAGTTAREFTTAFSDEVGLTTTTTRAAFVFPRPFGSFLQAFPRARPEELWRAHLQGEDFLRSKLAIRVEECRLPFLEGVKRDTIRKLSYVTSLRGWWVRGAYWFLVKRFMLHNQPVWKQDLSKLYGKATKVQG